MVKSLGDECTMCTRPPADEQRVDRPTLEWVGTCLPSKVGLLLPRWYVGRRLIHGSLDPTHNSLPRNSISIDSAVLHSWPVRPTHRPRYSQHVQERTASVDELRSGHAAPKSCCRRVSVILAP